MKIGIISMQRVKNYGSLLQAFALKRMLEQRGHEVSFIDIKVGADAVTPSRIKRFSFMIKKILLVDKYFFKRVEYSKKNKELDRKFEIYQKDYLLVDKPQLSVDGLDAVLIGSDEIFNCSSKSDIGIDGQRFGLIEGDAFSASYAASCGATSLLDTSENDKQVITRALNNMKAISVRDTNTARFVRNLTGKKPVENLDPVLIYDFKKELNIVKSSPREPYMVVYAYHNRINTKAEIQAIKGYAKKRGLKTIAIGGSLPWCDEFVVLDPFEVLSYFKNAECIVTDTFHGTVIATKFNKRVAILIRTNNFNKLDDLTRRLCIQKNVAHDASEIERILDNTDFDYSESNEIIDKGKKAALCYFTDIGL